MLDLVEDILVVLITVDTIWNIGETGDIYISNSVQYKRMQSLEGLDSHILIINLVGQGALKRIVNVYRSFNPQNNVNARMKFKYQLELIKNAMIDGCVILGDSNLDYAKVYDDNYCNKNMFSDFNGVLSEFNLIQLVNFETCSRLVGSVRRSSILDHIYIVTIIHFTSRSFFVLRFTSRFMFFFLRFTSCLRYSLFILYSSLQKKERHCGDLIPGPLRRQTSTLIVRPLLPHIFV